MNDSDWLAAPPAAVERFRKMGFGLFMHWDMSSLLGVEISWAKQTRVDCPDGDIPDSVYDQLYRSFNPAQFDARAIVATAMAAGMRYLVFTAKHHGGFCMFDSALTDYKITNTAFARDVVGELAEACHEAGLVFGLYYSQPDWHHPDFLEKDFDAFRPYLFGQVRELLTNYGRVDILFFDGLYYGDKEYHTAELFRMIRELQPDIVINNRCGLSADYDTPEQVVGAYQDHRVWESCMTLGTSWSWKTNDTLKSATDCIRILAGTAGGDGNLLLNVGPMPTGIIEPRQAAILEAIGHWLKANGNTLLGHRGGPYKPGAWGSSVREGDSVYLHVLSWFDLPEILPSPGRRVISAEALTGGSVSVEQDAAGIRLIPSDNAIVRPDTIIRLVLEGSAMTVPPMLMPTRSLARFCPVRSSCNQEAAGNVVDDDPASEWQSDANRCWLEIDLKADMDFNRIDIREEGFEWDVRTKDFTLECRTDEGDWLELDHGAHIGHTYSRRFQRRTGRFIRLSVHDSGKLPHFSEIQVYLEPAGD